MRGRSNTKMAALAPPLALPRQNISYFLDSPLISPHKTAIVPFTNRRKIGGLGPLILHSKELKMHEVKYLGVILDSKLNWNQHFQKIIRKEQSTFAVVRHICGKKWGLKPKMVHWLYTRVNRLSILHGVLVWLSKVMEKPPKFN